MRTAREVDREDRSVHTLMIDSALLIWSHT
jgi:hypothetical protein